MFSPMIGSDWHFTLFGQAFSIPWDIVIFLGILVLSSAFHEFGHAWAADKCGDTTPRELGRVTLNPIKHISLFLSVLLPGFIYWFSGGMFIFGGAKPVPVCMDNLRKPDRDMAIVAVAGPIANFIIVFICWFIMVASKFSVRPTDFAESKLCIVLINIIVINLLLGFFNLLLPIPPLDGSRILRYLYPFLRPVFDVLDYIGIIIVFFVVYYVPGVLDFIITAIRESIIVLWKIYLWFPF